MELFHFTDTSRLPWILSSGELRPGANKAGGFPEPEFVWATSNSFGDMSASVARGMPYQTGKVRHVRFAIGAEHFMPWRDVPQRCPAWTADQVARLETSAHPDSDPKTWWCCPRPIAAEHWLAIHSRSWTDNRWREVAPTTFVAALTDDEGTLWLGVEVAGLPFVSARITAPDGRTGYALR